MLEFAAWVSAGILAGLIFRVHLLIVLSVLVPTVFLIVHGLSFAGMGRVALHLLALQAGYLVGAFLRYR